MFRLHFSYVVLAFLLLGFTTAAQSTFGDDDCKLPGSGHDDNNPSSKRFHKLAYSASLCKIAICVDTEKCTNHDKVDWDKFKESPAYVNASKHAQKEIKEYHDDGNGDDGLVGYELLTIQQELND